MEITATSKNFKYSELPYGDKSVSHRALMLAAVSEKPSVFRNVDVCRDVLSTADCLSALGAKIIFDGETATVFPIEKPKADAVLFCGNSGTAARLLCGLIAGLGVKAVFCGDESLSARPMRMIMPLRRMGADIREKDGCLFEICPSKLNGVNYEMDFTSAQVKSAVLLAGIYADGETAVTEPHPTRKHTENMLKTFGADITEKSVDGKTCTAVRKSALAGADMIIPNDFSTAAFLLPLGLKYGIKIKNVLLSKERTGFLRVLARSGAIMTVEKTGEFCGEPTGDITVVPCEIAPLSCFEQTVPDMIDEIAAACVAACLANGVSVFKGLKELRNKESDRIISIAKLVNSIGCRAEICGDDLKIFGGGIILGGEVDPCGDHRIAMAGAVAGILSDNGVTVKNAELAEISSINFFRMLGLIK